MKKIKFTKLPSIVKNLNLSYEEELGKVIIPEEGGVIAIEALSHEGKNNAFEHISGRLGKLLQKDIIPAVFGQRKALREYSGKVPNKVNPGDELYFLCESGLIGEIQGLNEFWGQPMKVKVIGSIIKNGKQMNIKDFSLDSKDVLKTGAPIIAVIGTSMDCGKTTMICKIAEHLKSNRRKIAGAKLTGVAFMGDLLKMIDAGIYPVIDFVDAGLPSTCGNTEKTVNAAISIIKKLNKSNPYAIIVELGDGIMGEYNVAKILENKWFKKQVKILIVSANDFAGAWGAKQIINNLGLKIDLITGPVANNLTGVHFVEANINIPAESNLHKIPKTLAIIKNVVN